MRLGQVHVAFGRAQIRMPHQLRHTEDIDTGFDRSCAVGVPHIIEAKRRLNSTLPQRPKMRWPKFRHWPAPVVTIPYPARKEIFTFGLREPPLANGKRP